MITSAQRLTFTAADSDGATESCNPWEILPEHASVEDRQRVVCASQISTAEQARLVAHLDRVAAMDEMAAFAAPVDFAAFKDYCKAVAFPTDLATIRARLAHTFYRSKAALLWEVGLLERNAARFNIAASPVCIQAARLARGLAQLINGWPGHECDGAGDCRDRRNGHGRSRI